MTLEMAANDVVEPRGAVCQLGGRAFLFFLSPVTEVNIRRG